MLFSVPTRKGRLEAQLSPCSVPFLVKGNQISVSSSLRARFPHSAQLSSLMETSIQHNRSSVSSGHINGGTSSHRLRPKKKISDSRSQRQGWGKVHCFSRLRPRLVEGISEGSGALEHVVPSIFPGPSTHSLAQVCMSSRASGRRPESASYKKLLLKKISK